MAIPELDLEAGRGGTVRVVVQVLEADGTPASLVGYTGTMQVRSDPDSETVLATGTVVITAATGVVTGVVAAADTEDAEWGRAYYDMRIAAGTVVEYVVKGTITLHQTVTRP